jgi:hypothetical protein
MASPGPTRGCRLVTECALCGTESRDVRSGLACYADDGRFERIERCSDLADQFRAIIAAGKMADAIRAALATPADPEPGLVDWHGVASDLAPNTLTEWEAVVAKHTKLRALQPTESDR